MSRSTRSSIARLTAALATGALALPATAPAADPGGASGGAAPSAGSSPATGESAPPGPVVAANGFVLDARRATIVRRVHRVRGRVPAGAAGRPVSVQRLDSAAGWVEVARTRSAPDGNFLTSWRASRLGRIELRAVLAGDRDAAGAATATSPTLEVTVYKSARATWFGPGSYGERTACGIRLRKATLGVAHRRLACGTQVAISYRGRRIVVPVIDRGPFRAGVDWDLTKTTADELGADGLFQIGAVALVAGR